MEKEVFKQHKSSVGGMDANLVSLLVYLLPALLIYIPGIRYVSWSLPLIVYIMEKESSFVKFHAMQSFMFEIFGGLLVLICLGIGGFLGMALSNRIVALSMGNANVMGLEALGIFILICLLIGIMFGVFNIIAMIKAYKYQEYDIPIVGFITRKIVK